MSKAHFTGKHLLSLLLLTPACGVSEGGICSAADCSDSVELQLQTADGSDRIYDITLVLDEHEVHCPMPDAESSSIQTCDDRNVSVSRQELATCTQTGSGDTASQSCSPNGKFARVINVARATPAHVEVTLVDESGMATTHTAALEYDSYFPNGEECQPVCQRTTAKWTVE